MVSKLIKQTASVTQPREALLSADVQNDILAAAQSVAGWLGHSGSCGPEAAVGGGVHYSVGQRPQ